MFTLPLATQTLLGKLRCRAKERPTHPPPAHCTLRKSQRKGIFIQALQVRGAPGSDGGTGVSLPHVQRSGEQGEAAPAFLWTELHNPYCQEHIFRHLNCNSQTGRQTTTSEASSEFRSPTWFQVFVSPSDFKSFPKVHLPSSRRQPQSKPSKRPGNFRALRKENPTFQRYMTLGK